MISRLLKNGQPVQVPFRSRFAEHDSDGSGLVQASELRTLCQAGLPLPFLRGIGEWHPRWFPKFPNEKIWVTQTKKRLPIDDNNLTNNLDDFGALPF